MSKNFRWKKNKKIINEKKKIKEINKGNINKNGKEKLIIWKKTIRKQLDTIMDPLNKPYYCGLECNFWWKEISNF